MFNILCKDYKKIKLFILQTLSELTVFEASTKRTGDKRKKDKNTDAADIEGFLGPWAKYKDEKTVMKPSEVRLHSQV